MTADKPDSVEPTTNNGERNIEPPPILGTWPRLYALVLAVLAADILVFWLVTRFFS